MARLRPSDLLPDAVRPKQLMVPSLRMIALLVSIAALLGSVAVPAAADETVDQASTICPPTELTAELPAAPEGFVSYQVTTFANDCAALDGPVLFLPKATVAAAAGSSRLNFTPVLAPSVGQGVAAAGTGTISTHNEIKDAAGTITAVHTDTTWSWDGARVTSYNSGGWYAWHREALGVWGWYPVTVYNVQESSCVVATGKCASVTIHAHAEFRYRGTFDPSGLAFRNVHDNRPTVTKTGGWSCKIDMYARRFEPWWSWVKWCG